MILISSFPKIHLESINSAGILSNGSFVEFNLYIQRISCEVVYTLLMIITSKNTS